MDISKLAAFIKIVDLGALSLAASELGITQSALSQRVTALEAEFDAQLLLRSTHGVTATAAGRILYRHAQAMVRQWENTLVAVQTEKSDLTGRVSVGMPIHLATMFAVPLLLAARQMYPGTTLHIAESTVSQVAELLLNGQLDMALVPNMLVSKSLMGQPFVTEALFLFQVCDSSSDEPDEIAMHEVCDIPLVVPSRTHPLRQVIDVAFATAGLVPIVVIESDTLHETYSAIAGGEFATILPWASSCRYPNLQIPGTLRLRRIVRNDILWGSMLCVAENLPLSRVATVTQDLLVDIVAAELASDRWPGVRLEC